MWDLIVLVPDHCLSFYLVQLAFSYLLFVSKIHQTFFLSFFSFSNTLQICAWFCSQSHSCIHTVYVL